MPDLTPFDPEGSPEGLDEPKSGYMVLAGIVCGLIIAVGSQALQGHFEARPELAQSDPLMVQVITWARWLGWGLVGSSVGFVLWDRFNKKAIK